MNAAAETSARRGPGAWARLWGNRVTRLCIIAIGLYTPPVGVALYTCSSIMNCSVQETTRYAIPWFVAIFATLAVSVSFTKRRAA